MTLFNAAVGRRWRSHRVFLPVFFLLSLVAETLQAEDSLTNKPITDLQLEDLLKVQVTTPARKPVDVFDTPAAVYVIDGEDIARSGATTIPEALRMAPGLEVARISPHEWAITSRGFNGQFANKLLVLVDGRSVYTPMNSGVNWHAVDTLLQDIDRIEVVRGPGGTMWGANAVNGVINIITKSSKETEGFYSEIGGGTFEQFFTGMRYGGHVGDFSYRVYGKFFDRLDFPTRAGGSDQNDWEMAQGGFRADWRPVEESTLTLQGDLYGGTKHMLVSQMSYTPPFRAVTRQEIDLSGGNLVGRWTRRYGVDSEFQLQAYYDRSIRDSSYFDEEVQTYDLDLQNRWLLAERHDVMVGLAYRLISTDMDNGRNIMFRPDDRYLNLASAFVQDEISLLPDKLSLTLGTKVEHHYFTGWNVQPSGRLLWKPTTRQSLWGSVSRAVRTPSVGEHDIRSNFAVDPGPPLIVFAADATGQMVNEDVLAYELGYRIQPTERWIVDLATFYNVYDNFQTFEPGTPFVETFPAPTHLVFPFDARNLAYGETYGAELAGTYQATDWLRLNGSYTYLQIQMHAPTSLEPTAEASELENPHHQFCLGASFDLPANLQFDSAVRYVDELPGLSVPSYVALDARLAWMFRKNWELSVVGRNLLDNQHLEFTSSSSSSLPTRGSEVPREVYVKLTWKF